METEIAKAQNELRCAYKDVEKASKRIAFTLSAVHNLKERLDKDIQEESYGDMGQTQHPESATEHGDGNSESTE